MTTRNICILGGTGFVGRHLVARLAGDGHRVKVLTRYRPNGRDLLVLPTVSVVEADIRDDATLKAQFADCDTVINLVGILNESRRGGGFRAAHVELPRRVVDACRATGARRLLHMSALKADPAGPSNYLKSKGEGEKLVREAKDLDVTIFQPSVIFGPDDSFINRFAELLRLPFPLVPLPRPNARFAPVYIGDVVSAFARSLDDPDTAGNTYQLCGPQVLSLKEIIQFIASTMGVKRRVVGLGDSLSKLQARVMEFAPGKPFSVDNYHSMSINSICDVNGFEKLGIVPRSGQALIPRFLGARSARRSLSSYRERAGR